MTVASPVSPRHLRHRKRSRIRRSKDLKTFISKLQAVLNGTGSTVTPWTSAAVVGVAAAQTLTCTAIANGDTVTIGANVYTFQSALTSGAGHVKQTGVLATDLATLAKAINGTGIVGTDVGSGTVAHPTVTATSDATHLVATAIAKGVAANSVATTKVAAGATWGNTTLLGGVDQVNSALLAKATHGLKVGDGPFLATNVGGSLPTALPAATLLWVTSVPDTGHFSLGSSPRAAPLVLTGPGSGTNTLTKASTLEAVYDLLKKHGAPFMKNATDVDGI